MRQLRTPVGNLIFAFDSMTDYFEYLDKDQFKGTKPKVPVPADGGGHDEYDNPFSAFFGDGDPKYLDEDFVGESIDSWEALEQRIVSCWDIGIEALTEYIERLKEVEIPQIKSRVRRAEFSSDEGDEIDYEKLWAGDPKYWRTAGREEQTVENTLTVCIDTTTAGFHDTLDILWRGAAAIALTHHLEAKGYSVEVWVVNGSNAFRDKPQVSVMTAARLKKHSDPMDQSTLINGVAGWYYRIVTFTMIRTICKKMGEAVNRGLGAPREPGPADLRVITADLNPIYSSGIFSFSGARDMMVHELQRVANQQAQCKTE